MKKKKEDPKALPTPLPKTVKNRRKPEEAKKIFPVVGIGCSAGGLEALETFFASMPPPPTGMAFVVIQHLAPKHKSILGDILKRDTQMPVQEIHQGLKIEPDQIYLNPPARDVGLVKGVFHLAEAPEARGAHLPIDAFFRSLSEDQGERAICIVLSGTGSDGTLGLEAVKGAGGMTMAQAEEQAKYPFMPRSAIDTGLVDHILPVEKMPEELIRYAHHPYLERVEKPLPESKRFQNFMEKILLLVRTTTKHDFSHYKPNTIRRRIERRMAVHKIEDIAGYYKYLTENQPEVQTLFKDLVICVTSFFRDATAFKALESKIMPSILSQKGKDDSIRIWVPGCATGEEALSLAILLAEAMEKDSRHHPVQVFATDIDSDAIERARAGRYPESIAADVTSDRLKRWFVKEDAHYRVKPEIREMVVYAEQNVISDAPFSRLDLLSCRNVLIYLDSDLQKQLLPMFHYCLNPSGYLFLGSSETVGGFADLFETLDVKHKIYQRKGALAHPLREYAPLAARRGHELMLVGKSEKPSALNIRDFMESIILNDYAPAAVLVDAKYDIHYFQGDTRKYLAPPKGEPSFNLLKMVHEDLRPRLLAALHQAFKEKRTLELRGLTLKTNGNLSLVDVVIRPLLGRGLPPNLNLLIFEDKTPHLPSRRKGAKTPAEERPVRIAELEQELQATKQFLQTTIEELEASNEEMKSTNEELQSTNEELQSTNEELETAKEELQSTNEELVTVNSELQGKVDELMRVNDDLNNFLSATEIGIVFLDNDLKVQRFNPSATRLFNLISTDVGRPLQNLATTLSYANFYDDVDEVRKTLQVKEVDVQNEAGNWFNLRLLPYRTRENLITGVLLTFTDITAQRSGLMTKVLLSDIIVDTLREPLLALNQELKVIAANRAFFQVFKTNKKDTLDRPLYELGQGDWDIPPLRRLLEEIIPKNNVITDFEVEHTFPGLGVKSMLLNASRLSAVDRYPQLILLSIEDVTERKRCERELLETVQDLRSQLQQIRQERGK